MLKVIGAGFPRTGTTSTKAALELLGFGPCHHMFEVMTHPEQVDRLLPAASGAELDWDHVLEGYNATQDWPASFFWRSQAAAYPDAKVLLTVREPHGWYRSMRNLLTMGPRQLPGGPDGDPADLPADLPEGIRRITGTMMKLGPVMDLMVKDTFGDAYGAGDDFPPEDVAIDAFLRHQDAVRAALPAERLLVFDVREGWEPLCSFLEVPVPDEPYPHLNESGAMQEVFARVAAGGDFPTSLGDLRR